MNAPMENILVIRRSLFDELGAFQGLTFEPEKYLRAILSLGIGGHMAEDADKFLWHSTDEETYRAGVEREVNEEIKIDTPFEDRIVALLNDDSTEVGRVHLGIVHIFKLKEPKVE